VAFVVIYDACVLYPNVLRDVLIRVAMAGTVRARWTEAILDETFRNLRANRPDLDPDKLSRTRELMCEAVPDCLVTGYETLIEGLVLPDPDDRHVLAAAVRAGAQLIVTSNLKDFPDDALAAYGVEAKGPDDFLVDQYFLDEALLPRVIADISRSWQQPGGELVVVAALERAGLIQLAALLSS
jgi:predicted nucleic acid-binding protein